MVTIKGFPDYKIRKDGKVWSGLSNKFLKPYKTGSKSWPYHYLAVTLYRNSKPKVKRIHILVLENFVSERPLGKQGVHDDDNRKNNHLKNLRWATPKENYDDAVRNKKIIPHGENHRNAKLTNYQIRIIRRYSKTRGNQIYLASLFNVVNSCISDIINNKKRLHG